MNRRRLPPGPKRHFLIGSLPELGRDPLKFLSDFSQHGPIAHTSIGLSQIFLISDPELIDELLIGRYRECIKDVGTRELIPLVGQGLLTSEGELWKRQRKLAAPPLSPKRIAGYAHTMVECTERACASFRDGETRDIHVDMMALTLEIVGKTLLGFDASADAERVHRILDVSFEFQQAASHLAGPASEVGDHARPDRLPQSGRRARRPGLRDHRALP